MPIPEWIQNRLKDAVRPDGTGYGNEVYDKEVVDQLIADLYTKHYVLRLWRGTQYMDHQVAIRPGQAPETIEDAIEHYQREYDRVDLIKEL